MMKTAFVIRHSERDSVKDPLKHAEVVLNENGKKIAYEFGKDLSRVFPKVRVFSSPIERCIQTGKCIQAAFDDDSEIQISYVLGEPGPFVFGDAADSFVRLGTAGVVEAIENGESLQYIRKEEEGTKILLDYLRKETEKSDSQTATVFITHDACVAPAINFLIGEFFNHEHWIEFLGGLRIDFDTNSLTIKRI